VGQRHIALGLYASGLDLDALCRGRHPRFIPEPAARVRRTSMEPLALLDIVLWVVITSADAGPQELSAFCLMASNSACEIAPWSSSCLALAISVAAPPPALSRTYLSNCAC